MDTAVSVCCCPPPPTPRPSRGGVPQPWAGPWPLEGPAPPWKPRVKLPLSPGGVLRLSDRGEELGQNRISHFLKCRLMVVSSLSLCFLGDPLFLLYTDRGARLDGGGRGAQRVSGSHTWRPGHTALRAAGTRGTHRCVRGDCAPETYITPVTSVTPKSNLKINK